MPSSAMTTFAITRSQMGDMSIRRLLDLTRLAALGGPHRVSDGRVRGGFRRGLEPRLQIRENRIEGRAQRNQKAPRALAITPAADVAFPEPRDDAAEVLPVAADVATVAQVRRPCAGVAVKTPEHVGDVAIDIMANRQRERFTLWSRERDGWMHPLLAPAFGPVAEQCAMRRPAERGAP